jgi:hypothetical protein
MSIVGRRIRKIFNTIPGRKPCMNAFTTFLKKEKLEFIILFVIKMTIIWQ